jgi:hypothetical protein
MWRYTVDAESGKRKNVVAWYNSTHVICKKSGSYMFEDVRHHVEPA